MPARDSARATAEAVARRGYGKLVAYLAAGTRDVAAAEDALSDAFAAALVDWPKQGVPANPEAWLLAVARRKSIDAGRRRLRGAATGDRWRLVVEELDAMRDLARNEPIPDRRLALMFACAHPAIDAGVRAPLMLQAILGFEAATIASAFLVSPASMSQRLVRAKAKIRRAAIPLRVPDRADLGERLDAVLEAIYAVFAEGWSDPAGIESRRRDLAEEGVWLGRLVVSLLPEAETLGLLALMLYIEARRGARRDAKGEYVALADQDPAVWNRAFIDEAEGLLFRAGAMKTVGRYQIEAAIQSAHVVRRLTGRADWGAIVKLYDVLIAMTGSPVVAINRAVAIAEIDGAAAGLAALEAVSGDERLRDYQPYWAARADLLARAGQPAEADKAYEIAVGLEPDAAVRRFLQRRRAQSTRCGLDEPAR